MTSTEVALRLARLGGLTADQLRADWRLLYRTSPPRCLSRDLLARGIAHRIQERALGGLSQAARRRLGTLGRALEQGSAFDPAPSLKPGAKLIREWHGETHSILVLEDGFSYRDRHYGSLTQIAGLITGAHWSGPRFFGLSRGAATDG